jgi:hypothetical protein
MIRPLRRRHRAVVIVLAIVLPVVFAIAIATRKPVPVMPVLPELRP